MQGFAMDMLDIIFLTTATTKRERNTSYFVNELV